MALLNFPDPSVIQTYTANGNSWDWNGTSWVSANNLNLSDQVSGVLGTVYGYWQKFKWYVSRKCYLC